MHKHIIAPSCCPNFSKTCRSDLKRVWLPEVWLNRSSSNHCVKWQSKSTVDICRKISYFGTARELPAENLPDDRTKIRIRPDTKITNIQADPDPDWVPSLVFCTKSESKKSRYAVKNHHHSHTPVFRILSLNKGPWHESFKLHKWRAYIFLLI